jgi:hypothetical protein
VEYLAPRRFGKLDFSTYDGKDHAVGHVDHVACVLDVLNRCDPDAGTMHHPGARSRSQVAK